MLNVVFCKRIFTQLCIPCRLTRAFTQRPFARSFRIFLLATLVWTFIILLLLQLTSDSPPYLMNFSRQALFHDLSSDPFLDLCVSCWIREPEYCNIMHADGAGTKTSLAYMYWKETGDTSVWRGIAQDSIIMNLDDLICVGACDNILLSSTIGFIYHTHSHHDIVRRWTPGNYTISRRRSRC